jgi:hypothetical protein
MLSLRTAPAAILALLIVVGCHRSGDDAAVIGNWQYNPRVGECWRYTFASDHTFVISLPEDETVDVTLRDARFYALASGTWHVEGNEVVYTIHKLKDAPVARDETTRMKLSDFKNAKVFGTDHKATLERM